MIGLLDFFNRYKAKTVAKIYFRSCLKSQNNRTSGQPKFISESDIQCDGILKQVQDDEDNGF